MNYRLHTILPLLFLLFAIQTQAQQELGLHFMGDIWQSAQTNPSTMNDHRIVVALPGVAGSFYHPAFSINDALQKRSGSNFINLDDIVPQLEESNQLFSEFQADIVGAAYRLGNNIQIGASWSVRGSAYADYTREAFDVLWNGNAGYIGEVANVAADFQFTAYNEIGLSAAYSWRDKISIGAKFKLLNGFSDISTDRDEQVLTVETADDVYQVAFTTDFVFRRAGFPPVDGAYDLLSGLQLYNFDTSNNTGFGFDIGITANLTKKLTISAAVIDLGSLTWQTDTQEYTSRGKFNYGGLDLFSYISGDTINSQLLTDDLEFIADDLTDRLDIRNTTEEGYSYTTPLHTRGYLSGTYLLNDMTLGAAFYLDNTPLGTQPGFAISARKPFGKWVTAGATYAVRNGRFNNLGLNATGHLGPVQVYVVSDNIAAAVNPFGSKNFNFRFGINLVFGKIKIQKRGSMLEIS